MSKQLNVCTIFLKVTRSRMSLISITVHPEGLYLDSDDLAGVQEVSVELFKSYSNIRTNIHKPIFSTLLSFLVDLETDNTISFTLGTFQSYIISNFQKAFA